MQIDDFLLERTRRVLSKDAIFQRMASDLIISLLHNINLHARENHRYYGISSASELGSASLSELVNKKFYRSRLMDKDIKKFIEEKGNLAVLFNNNLKPNIKGCYIPSTEIYIRIDNEKFDSIIDRLKNNQSLNLRYDEFSDKLGIMVHELTHAYDDWKSKGKYQSNERSKIAQKSAMASYFNPQNKELKDKKWADYYIDPIEINARFYQTVSNINQNLSNVTWKEASWKFSSDFGRWREIPKDEQRKLIKRFARVWLGAQRKPNKDYKEDVATLKTAINQISDGIYARYSESSQSLVIDIGINNSVPRDVLNKCIKFCDIRNITLGLETAFTPQLKTIGFVPNKGRTKRYDLSWSTTCYREPKRKQ